VKCKRAFILLISSRMTSFHLNWMHHEAVQFTMVAANK